MRKFFPLLIIFFLISGFTAQTFGQDKRLKTPQKTLKTVIKAIKSHDLELYQLCWLPKSLESEGMFSRLQDDPQKWAELEGIFKGPQKLINANYLTKDGLKRCKATVRAPKAEGGGIGTINFVKHEGNWVLWKW